MNRRLQISSFVPSCLRALVPPFPCLLLLIAAGAGDGSTSPDAQRKPTDRSSEATSVPSEDAVRAAREMLDRAEFAVTQAERDELAKSIKEYIESIRSAEPQDAWLLYLQGRLNVVSGRFSEARDQLRAFLETREGRNEWSAYRVLGDLFVEQFPRLAKFQYDRAVELKPNEPTTLLGLSICEQKLADLDNARQHAQEAVLADGRRNVRYLVQFATVLKAQKRWAQAESEAAEALELAEAAAAEQPGDSEVLQRVEAQYRLLTEIADGLLRESPGEAVAYTRLAGYVRKHADVQRRLRGHDALAVLALGVERTAPNVPIELRAAYAIELAEVGRRQEATAQFELVLAADPNHALAREWLTRLSAKPTAPSP